MNDFKNVFFLFSPAWVFIVFVGVALDILSLLLIIWLSIGFIGGLLDVTKSSLETPKNEKLFSLFLHTITGHSWVVLYLDKKNSRKTFNPQVFKLQKK